MSTFVVVPEKCRVCGCTELSPCVFEGDDGAVACTWMDFDHTLCSNLECVAKIPLSELEEMPLYRIALARGAAA